MKPTDSVVRPVFLTKKQELNRTLRSFYKLPSADSRSMYKIPFANLFLVSPPDICLQKLNFADADKINWLQHAKAGVDVRFLMREILRLGAGAGGLGKLVEIDIDAGRWALKMMLRQSEINAAERETWGPDAKVHWKTFIYAIQHFEAEIHAVRSAIARKIEHEALVNGCRKAHFSGF